MKTQTEKSFFRTMLEEKNLINESFTIRYKGLIHYFEVEVILELIENTVGEERQAIEKAFRLFDLYNADLLYFLKQLAFLHVQNNFKGFGGSNNA
jgi:hypothetical protein